MYILRTTTLLSALFATAVLLLAACSDSSDPSSTNTISAATLPDTLFLSEAPDGPQSITSLKATAKEGDEVVVRVIVGGTDNPIVDGRASATIIDASVQNACVGEDDHCQTPWDYCCTAQEVKTANLATLQLMDEQGKVLKADLTQRVKPLSTLVVRGVVGPRPDDQVLTIHALGIYIEPEVQ